MVYVALQVLLCQAYGNQTLIYMGKVDGINAFHSSYSKTYLNLKMPIIEENCIKIKSSEFKEPFPYDVVLETDQSYTQRICANKTSEGHITWQSKTWSAT